MGRGLGREVSGAEGVSLTSVPFYVSDDHIKSSHCMFSIRIFSVSNCHLYHEFDNMTAKTARIESINLFETPLDKATIVFLRASNTTYLAASNFSTIHSRIDLGLYVRRLHVLFQLLDREVRDLHGVWKCIVPGIEDTPRQQDPSRAPLDPY
jgi:hypothetical protein